MGTLYPAGDMMEALRNYHEALGVALLEEVKRRENGRRGRRLPKGVRAPELVRRKVEPMVTALFQPSERAVVLSVLEQGFVFLTRKATHQLVHAAGSRTAWTVANIYLASLGAECLGEGDWNVVGSCEGNRCYVSMEYFGDTSHFADYVVHEAAHVFHNTKRVLVGLPSTRYREWLLEIEFRKRETFAYACEAYSRILEQASRPTERAELLAEYAAGPMPHDDRVDADELIDILRETVPKRNGWKHILQRCAPRSRRRAAARLQEGQASCRFGGRPT
jgi:hypothetical protein